MNTRPLYIYLKFLSLFLLFLLTYFLSFFLDSIFLLFFTVDMEQRQQQHLFEKQKNELFVPQIVTKLIEAGQDE